MLIKDKDITSYQLLLIKQDRVLVLASLTSFFDYTVVNLKFFFFTFRKKWVGRAMGNETFYWDGQETSSKEELNPLKTCYSSLLFSPKN